MLHLSFIINSRPLRTLLLDENESIVVAASVRSYRLLCVSVAPTVVHQKLHTNNDDAAAAV